MVSPEFTRPKISHVIGNTFSLSEIQQFLNFGATLSRNFCTCTVNVPLVPVSKFWEVLVESKTPKVLFL